ncbi:MAG TPA: hypothetical protein VGC21_10295 [Telluria sp.]|jgi:hypothetical protein
MENFSEEYKGFTIVVTPVLDHGDLWDFNYRITKTGQGGQDGDPGAAITRSQSAGGHATERAAGAAGMAVARTEVDNILALARSHVPAGPGTSTTTRSTA